LRSWKRNRLPARTMNSLGDYDRHRFDLKGKTAESVVHELAFQSFLREWCYPNPRDHKGKEICDLLVVYDGTLIIFSVKDIAFSGNYERYHRKAFVDSIRQLIGAERRLMASKSAVNLRTPKGFSHGFDPTEVHEIFRIAVSLGSDDVPYDDLDKHGGKFVHAFDRSFGDVISELDTMLDFTDYLRKKEFFYERKGKGAIQATREQDVLAEFLFNGRTFDHLESFDMSYTHTGVWESVQSRPEFIARRNEDRISYLWDHLIEVTHTAVGDDYRIIARELASTNRFARRALSKSLLDGHAKALKLDAPKRLFRRVFQTPNGRVYAFLFANRDCPRSDRVLDTKALAMVATLRFPNWEKVIGIGTEIGADIGHTYDFVLIERETWEREDEEAARAIMQEHGILTMPEAVPFSLKEFPSSGKGDK